MLDFLRASIEAQRLGESCMTCVELQESLAAVEDGSRPEQQAHINSCPQCAALVADLLVIACAASELRAAQEPSPRVWNSIETALRREGLIRPQRSRHSLLPSFGSHWGWARWLAPAAAVVLIAVGIYVRQHSEAGPTAANPVKPAVSKTNATPPDSDIEIAGLNDEDLMQEIGQQSPALQAEYTDNLRQVNEYIRDAKTTVAADPNDQDARRLLMEAYQEKAMLFELALDRSLQ
jgi:hypothetical protein